MVRAQLGGFARGLVQHLQAAQVALALGVVLDDHVRHALLEADLAAHRNDLLAQVFHHLHQLEGADVRVGDVQNFFGCTGLDELVHHLAAQVARVFDLAVELAVREGTSAALAKLHVAFGVERALAPQAPGVLGALAHGLATFQHDGLEAHLRQHQCRKDAAGAKAHHHRAQGHIGRRLAHRVPGHIRRGLDVRVAGEPGEQRGFALGLGQRDIDDVDGQQVGLAGVKAAFENVDVRDVGGRQPQQLRNGSAQGRLGGLGHREGQPDFRESDHGFAGPCRSGGRQSRGAVILPGVAFLRTVKPCGARLR